MANIFMVEDNEMLREAVVSYLRLDDHNVKEFGRLSGVLEAVKMNTPDLIILDIMLPDGSGFALAKQIRQNYNVPIIFLTAKSAESDRITGLELGADDYVTKPFSTKELSLRVKAILKRNKTSTIAQGGLKKWALKGNILTIDNKTHTVTLNDSELELTAFEWKILNYLASHPGIVIDRDELLGKCLDYSAEGSERTIDTHIKNIRSKLKDASWIKTVRGFGYRFSGKIYK